MTIDNERPEDELHADRASELLTVIALIYADSQQGEPGAGSIVCPACRGGVVEYAIGFRGGAVGQKRALRARCTTPGCIAFMS